MALFVTVAIWVQRPPERTTSDETPDQTLMPAPSRSPGSAPSRSAPGIGDDPEDSSVPTDLTNDVPTIESEGFGHAPDGSLSNSRFPELRLPPVAGIHEHAAVFASEGRDFRWSAEMEGRIYDAIAQTGISANTLQVECRETLCRVYIDYPADTEISPADNSLLVPHYQDLGLTVATAFRGSIENRLPVGIVYLSRDMDSVP